MKFSKQVKDNSEIVSLVFSVIETWGWHPKKDFWTFEKHFNLLRLFCSRLPAYSNLNNKIQ